MNALDIIILIPFCFGMVRGFIKGFVRQAASLAGLVVGVYCANFFSTGIAQLLADCFNTPIQYGKVIAFCIIFTGIGIASYFAAVFVSNLLKKIALSGLNRLVGALFGGLKYLLVISIFINVLQAVDEKVHVVADEQKNNSLLYYPAQKFVLTILPYIHFSDFTSAQNNEEKDE